MTIRNVHRISTYVVTLLSLLGAFMTVSPVQAASPASISGNWNGKGQLVLKSGSTEQFRCRINYRRISGQNFALKARCANQSGSFEQTGQLQRKSMTRYVGTIRNTQFNISAAITVAVKGSVQNISISSSEGSAKVRLTRR